MTNTYTMHNGKRITMTSDQLGVSERAPEWAKQEWRVTLRHNGRRMTFPYYGGGAASDPTCDDVVESIAMDASALSMNFEEWCADYGYDVDSRQAHKTYTTCRSLGKRFTRMMGG